MRLLITGTRHGRPDVESVLEEAVNSLDIELFVLGDAAGVDDQALEWIARKGLTNWEQHHARWSRLGALAGPERNRRMVASMRPGDLAIAFPDRQSKGTWDCIRQCLDAGVHVVVMAMPKSEASL